MMKPKFISLEKFAIFVTWLKEALLGKVDKEQGKSLVDDAQITKLEALEADAQENVIESISVNGVTQVVDNNKNAQIYLPINRGATSNSAVIGRISGNTASKQYAIAEGSETTASGEAAHSEGERTVASGNRSHAEGVNTEASGGSSHAEGQSTKATEFNAHAEGANTTASGQASHAQNSATTASGNFSSAEGRQSVASGQASHAQGTNTIASRLSQFVFGEYNVEDTGGSGVTSKGNYVEIVGNGTSTTRRSNARTLDWSGNEILAGKLTVGANPTTSMDVATKGYVDEGLANIDLTDYATKAEIPIKVSELTNDSNFTNKTYVDTELAKKQDTLSFATPTVENVGKALMAKTISGGKVTEWELGEAGKVDDVQVNGISVLDDKVASITVPTNNNQLINGAGYQTASDVNATIATAIQDLVSTRYYVCETGEYDTTTYVPTLEGELGVIYLVPKPIGVSGYDDDSLVGTAPVGTATIANTVNIFYEYIYTGEKFEQIGDTKVDLTGYLTDADIATNSDVTTMLNQVFS